MASVKSDFVIDASATLPWCFDDEGLRCASRYIENPLFGGGDREGFRCVLNIDPNTVAVEPKGKLATTWGEVKKASGRN